MPESSDTSPAESDLSESGMPASATSKSDSSGSGTKQTGIGTAAKPAIAGGYLLQFEAAQDTWVLLYPEWMVKLNPSAAEILKRCNGETSVAAITADLESAFNTTGLAGEVDSFLSIARQQHWIKLN